MPDVLANIFLLIMFILTFSINVNTSANQMIAKYLTKDAEVSQCVVDFSHTPSLCTVIPGTALWGFSHFFFFIFFFFAYSTVSTIKGQKYLESIMAP